MLKLSLGNRLDQLRASHWAKPIGLVWLIACLVAAGYCFTRQAADATTSTEPSRVTKAIEDIKVGDWVLAKDPSDPGPPTPHKVIALPRNWTEHVVHVRVQGGGELQATRIHPFWVEGKGWTNAVALRAGDRLIDDQGRAVTVEQRCEHDKTTDTYNLTIDGVHTYYVIAGNYPVLVHNMGIVYKVPGSGTPSGLPYIGRSDNWGRRQNYSGDGRDRTQAQQIDTYPDGDTQAGRQAEQNGIDSNGGVNNLDNKRNEIAKPCP